MRQFRSLKLLNVVLILLIGVGVLWRPLAPRAADTLPSQYMDSEFWRLVTDFSEPGGSFPYENFVSNEISYQDVIPDLKRFTQPGGVYLGVAPEQNFTYIAAIQPKVAFIFDIRRQNLVELLMYKSVFEMSPDRSDFVSRLFSRRRPAGLTATTPVKTLFDAYNSVRPDPQLYAETLQAIKDRLVKQHQFTISRSDERTMEYVFNVFFRGGPRMDYAYASASPNNLVPSYYNLMVSTDSRGQNWAYLASENNYQRIRQMQQKNLIVPIVGDFAGPKAIKSVAKYLKDHGAVVTVFYISNVEDYLVTSWPNYAANIAALPTDPRSSVFIRFVPRTITTLRLMKDLPSRWPGRNW